MQAVISYGMLCAQYTEYIASEDAAWLVTTIEVRNPTFHRMSSHGIY